MLLTSDKASEDAIGALFDDVIFPLSVRVQRSGELPFPLKPDTMPQSYYVPAARATMRPEDFTAPSCLDCDDFGQRLATHWQAGGRDELLVAVPSFVTAARAVQANFDVDGPQDVEVSPFIYVMF